MTEAAGDFAVRGLSKVFRAGGVLSGRRHVALDGVSLSLPAASGQVLAIVGESGSSKTTLARCVLRLVAPDAGEVVVDGQCVVGAGAHTVGTQRFRQLVQPIFQNPFETFSLKLPVDEYLHRTAINLGGCRDARAARPAVQDALGTVKQHYLWRAVDGGASRLRRTGVLDTLVQSRRNTRAARRVRSPAGPFLP